MRFINSTFEFLEMDAKFPEDTIRLLKIYINWAPVVKKENSNIENTTPLSQEFADKALDDVNSNMEIDW